MKDKICISIDRELNQLIKENMTDTKRNKSQVIEGILKTHFLASVLFEMGKISDDG